MCSELQQGSEMRGEVLLSCCYVQGSLYTVVLRIVRHHVTFLIFPTNLQKLLKSRKNYCCCQQKSAVMRDRRIIHNTTVLCEILEH